MRAHWKRPCRDDPPDAAGLFPSPGRGRATSYDRGDGRARPPRLAPRLLRRRRARRRDGRARARALRRRRSTSASRSSTTSTSSATSRRAARSSSRARTRCPTGATVVFSAHGVAPAVHANSADARPQRDRRDLPARDEGARAGAALRGRRLHGRPDRPRRPRGGRRDDGRGARGDGARPGRSTEAEALDLPRRRQARLRHADDALGRRDRRDHRARSAAASPTIHAPKKEDICYATSNRQWAVKEMLPRSTSCS